MHQLIKKRVVQRASESASSDSTVEVRGTLLSGTEVLLLK